MTTMTGHIDPYKLVNVEVVGDRVHISRAQCLFGYTSVMVLPAFDARNGGANLAVQTAHQVLGARLAAAAYSITPLTLAVADHPLAHRPVGSASLEWIARHLRDDSDGEINTATEGYLSACAWTIDADYASEVELDTALLTLAERYRFVRATVVAALGDGTMVPSWSEPQWWTDAEVGDDG